MCVGVQTLSEGKNTFIVQLYLHHPSNLYSMLLAINP